jgi:acyl carrier protein
MTREEVFAKLNEIFRDVFNDDSIVVGDVTTAKDIQGWDSLRHITLLSAIEDEFGFKFKMKDVVGLHNVGEMVDVIMEEVN